MKFINLHTHLPALPSTSPPQADFSLISLDLVTMTDPLSQLAQINFPFTLGIHPWSVETIEGQRPETKSWKEVFQQAFSHPHFWGMGEMGLDRKCRSSWEGQRKWVQWQLSLAREHSIPVLFIHCVRAFPDVIELIKKLNYQGQVIFHDYNANMETTAQLLRMPNKVYFSFGAKLFSVQTSAARYFTDVPPSRIFLETDSQREISIQTIYEKAAELRRCELSEFQSQIEENFRHCFSMKEFK